MITSLKSDEFRSAVRGFRDMPTYRVMIQNCAANADECIGTYVSRTEAMRRAQEASKPGNTAWVIER